MSFLFNLTVLHICHLPLLVLLSSKMKHFWGRHNKLYKPGFGDFLPLLSWSSVTGQLSSGVGLSPFMWSLSHSVLVLLEGEGQAESEVLSGLDQVALLTSPIIPGDGDTPTAGLHHHPASPLACWVVSDTWILVSSDQKILFLLVWVHPVFVIFANPNRLNRLVQNFTDGFPFTRAQPE